MAKIIVKYDRDQLGKLHCDDCGYDIPEPQAFTPKLIGTPCPKCGANMLTEEDYKSTERLLGAIDIANTMLGPIFGKEENAVEENDGDKINVKIHGDEMTIRKGPA